MNVETLNHFEKMLHQYLPLFVYSLFFPPSVAELVSEIMSIGLFFQLLVCAGTVAVYMVGIDSNPHLNVNLGVLCIGMSVTLSSTAIYCYLSENVTTALEEIGNTFFEFDWSRLPPKHQKLFLLPIQRSQLNFRLTGLKLVDCSLRVFSSVRMFHLKNVYCMCELSLNF